jgi:hypothetical protein
VPPVFIYLQAACDRLHAERPTGRKCFGWHPGVCLTSCPPKSESPVCIGFLPPPSIISFGGTRVIFVNYTMTTSRSSRYLRKASRRTRFG